MQIPELDAYVTECTAAEQTLAHVPAEAWTRNALGFWTLAELVGHLIAGGGSRLREYVDRPVDPAAPVLDRVSYYRTADGVPAQAVGAARTVDAETLPALFEQEWRDDAALAAELPPDRVIQTRHGPIRADEFLATRVLEVTIHHLDVRAALDLPPAPTADAGRITMALLEGLLGAPRPRNLGRVRFLLTATGRLDSDDPRFPVLR